MTRINAGIPPEELTRQHLIAEHREIKRVPNQIKSGRYSLAGMPNKFCLGAGHVKFFYKKQGYLLKRYKIIHAECLIRGYNVQDYSNAWEGLSEDFMQDWTPTLVDAAIVRERIRERLEAMK